MSNWEKFSEQDVAHDLRLDGSARAIIHRHELADGWLVMTTLIHDQRAKIGTLDLSTKMDRLMSVRTETSTTFVPDPEKRWKTD